MGWVEKDVTSFFWGAVVINGTRGYPINTRVSMEVMGRIVSKLVYFTYLGDKFQLI